MKKENKNNNELIIPVDIIGLENLKLRVGDKIVPFNFYDVDKTIGEIKTALNKEDNLQYIMDCQRKFQGRFGEDFNNMTDDERAVFIKNHGYFIIEEVVELFRETKNHKSWKDYSDWTGDKMKEQMQKAKEEYIDVFHFVVNVGLALGLDSNEILRMYKEKNKVNIERQENPELGYVK